MKFGRPIRRGFLATMVAVGVVALALAWSIRGAMARRDAVAAIRKAGGTVLYDYQYRKQQFILGRPEGGTWARSLLGADFFDRVVRVEMIRNADDSLMPSVARLEDLEELDVRGSPVTDAGLAYVSGLAKLRTLGIADTRATARSFAALEDLKKLGGIDTSGIPVDDEALVHLGRMKVLESLDLKRCPITDAGLANLGTLRELLILDIADTPIGDEGLAHLANCRALRGVVLDGTRITRAGLVGLLKLPDLKVVNVRRTAITDADIAELAKSHPGVKLNR